MKRNRPLLLAPAALALLLLAWPARGIDVPLTYKRSDQANGFAPYGYGQVKTLRECPEGNWRQIPKPVGKNPIYFLVKLGESERLGVMDLAEKDDTFYNRFYFDANGDGDLLNDPVHQGDSQNSGDTYYYVNFESVDTTIHQDGVDLPYAFSIYSYYNVIPFGPEQRVATTKPLKDKLSDQQFQMLDVRLSVGCFYSGTFESDGTSYQVALGDYNGNGSFSDTFDGFSQFPEDRAYPLYTRADNVYIERAGKPLDYYKGQALPGTLVLGEDVYSVDVDIPNGKMILEPVTGELATVAFPVEPDRLQLVDKEAGKTVAIVAPGKDAKVPPGEYTLLDYLLITKDEQGDTWRLAARGSTESPSLRAGKGEEKQLTFGEPYSPDVVAQPFPPQQNGPISQVSLDFQVVGTAREIVSDLAHTSGNRTAIAMSKSNGNRPKEPTYKIVKGDGEVVTSSSFEYG